MRTDVKVGLICGLFIVGSGIAYFAFPANNQKPSLPRMPSLTADHPTADQPNVDHPVIVGAAETPAVSLAPAPAAASAVATGPVSSAAHSLLGPSIALAADAPPATTNPAVSVSPSLPPVSDPAPAVTPASGNTLVLEPPPAAGAKPMNISTPAMPTISGGPVINPPAPSGVSLQPPAPSNSSGLGSVSTPSGPTLQLDSTPMTTGGSSTYVIKKGDSFARIAKATFGNQKPATIKAIQDANPGVDSQHLKIGKTINLPALPSGGALASSDTAATPAADGPTTRPASSHKHRAATASTGSSHAASPGGTYVVKRGDNLHKIAKAVYGDERRWRQIARTNRDIITDPDDLVAGTVLRLPTAQ